MLWGVEIRSIAEIGVFEGGNATLLRILFPGCQLYLIDPWEYYSEYQTREARPYVKEQERYEIAYQRVLTAFGNDSRCAIHRKTSAEAAPLVSEGLDLVFIDGNHSYEYVKEDLSLWAPKVRKGGIIAGHDYNERLFPDVVRAVREEFGDAAFVLPKDDVWAVLKK